MAQAFDQVSRAELKVIEEQLSEQLEQHHRAGLKLDLTRGKPGSEQLDLANKLDGILDGDYRDSQGSDTRNYGGIDGIPEARALFSSLLEVAPEETLVGGNSSLTLMYFCALFAMHHGPSAQDAAWEEAGAVKFLAPSPGYDRHFTICEQLNIGMIPVAMRDDGPDMDEVERHLDSDPAIKGIWCVPRFSNPTGAVYSAEVLQRLARAAGRASPGFRVFCDNAYAMHAFEPAAPTLPSVMDTFKQAGAEDTLYLFGSTSKITFAGAGVGYLAMSAPNLAYFKSLLGASQIGPDKINQLRHVKLLKDAAGVESLMRKHAELLKPRFDAVLKHLQEGLSGLDIAEWTKPSGGYFVSLDTRPGLARKVVELSASAGVKLTPAGATFPYGRDPEDSNIRIAPSFPSLPEINLAMSVLVNCVKLATVRQLLAS